MSKTLGARSGKPIDRDTFSREVKEDLARTAVKGRSQAYWEALALREFLSVRSRNPRDGSFPVEPFIVRRLYYLTKQGSGMRTTVSRGTRGSAGRARGRFVPGPASGADGGSVRPSVGRLRESASLRRAYLRGVFLARGSAASPARAYHLELALPSRKDAALVRSLLSAEGLRCGIVERRTAWVVYMKDGDDIAEFLKAVGATGSVLQYEDVRVRKSLKGSVQRLVNMDRANVARSVEASLKQIADIRLIDEEKGIRRLPHALRRLALIRLANPDMCMEELGQALSPPASKSAVNHRFRRIAAIASEMRAACDAKAGE